VIRKPGDKLALGPAGTLTVTWKRPPAQAGTGPLLTADGKITVSVDEKMVTTVADLTLRDERGQTRDWILGAPQGAIVEVRATTDRTQAPATVTLNAKTQEHTIHLKEPNGEPLRVLVRVEQPRMNGRMPIGPFSILNAMRQPGAVMRRQQGTILIKEPPPGLFLNHDSAAEGLINVRQKEKDEGTDEDKRTRAAAVFEYSYAPGSKPGQTYPPLLTLEVKTVHGVVETRVQHALQLEAAEHGWQVEASMNIVVESQRTPIRTLDVQLPRAWPLTLAILACWPRPGLPVNLALVGAGLPGSQPGRTPWTIATGWYQLDRAASTTESVESIGPVDANGRIRITLAEQKGHKVALTLKGIYTLPRDVQRIRLELPRLLQTLDRGSGVEIAVPPGQELVRAGGEGETLSPGKHAHTLRPAPQRVEFAWRTYRPEMAVGVQTDLTLGNRQARVRQRVQFPAQPALPAQVLLRLASGPKPQVEILARLNNSLRVQGGSRLDSDPGNTAQTSWPIALQLKKDRFLELEYAFPVPETGLVQVPLLWPEEATQVNTKVRVWRDPGLDPDTGVALQGQRWVEKKTELVSGRGGLPELVLRGLEREMPLALIRSRTGPSSLASVLVERALIRAVVTPEGGETYRARFLVSRWNSRALALELPAGASQLSVHVGRDRVTPRKQEKGPAERKSAPAVYLLPVEPDASSTPAILDIVYQIKPEGGGREPAEDVGWLGQWRTVLQPPVLRDAVYLGRVRWQVELSTSQILLFAGNEAIVEQEWGLRGWLLAPQAALGSAELEEWLTGSNKGGMTEETRAASPGLVCWQGSPQALYLVHLPEKPWLLGCSLLCLALGLGLSFVPLSRGPYRLLCWSVAGVVGLAAALTALVWPAVIPAILYGCEPAIVILVAVLGVQWMLQRRYRRQLVFMPGFTRLKPGSSLVRTGSSNRPREPSTVDVPPVPESPVVPSPSRSS
jgi:hypothetical protein